MSSHNPDDNRKRLESLPREVQELRAFNATIRKVTDLYASADLSREGMWERLVVELWKRNDSELS